MSKYRTTKRDSNQGEIVKGLKKCGCKVVDLASQGDGVPDLLVGVAGKNFLIEVIGPDKFKRFPPDGLSPNQVEWHEIWPGPVFTVRTTQEALDCMGLGHRSGVSG